MGRKRAKRVSRRPSKFATRRLKGFLFADWRFSPRQSGDCVRALRGDATFLRSFVSFFFRLFGHRALALDRPGRYFDRPAGDALVRGICDAALMQLVARQFSLSLQALRMFLAAGFLQRLTFMHRNMIGFTTLDFILRVIFAHVMGISFVIEVFRMNFDDLAAHMASLRVPSYVIADFESFRHHEPPIIVWFRTTLTPGSSGVRAPDQFLIMSRSDSTSARRPPSEGSSQPLRSPTEIIKNMGPELQR